MRLRQQSIATAAVWVTLGLFLAFSSPIRLPVVLFIVPFVLLFIALYGTWRLGQQFAARYASVEVRHRRLGIGVCGTAVLLLVLQSLGQLTLRDVITLAAIVVVGYLYFGRTSLGLSQH